APQYSGPPSSPQLMAPSFGPIAPSTQQPVLPSQLVVPPQTVVQAPPPPAAVVPPMSQQPLSEIAPELECRESPYRNDSWLVEFDLIPTLSECTDSEFRGSTGA